VTRARGRALVVGAGGFVGRHLAGRLAADGWEVVGTVRPGRAGGVPVDLTDPAALTAVVRAADPDVAFHLAASRVRGTADERTATAAVNTMSGLHLVEALGERCRAVVRLGSSTEYAAVEGPMDEHAPLRPRGLFGATKAAGSLLLTAAAAERGLRAVVLRAFQVYGPHDHPTRLVPAVLRAAREGTVLPLTAPGQRRDWVHVDDVVDACVRAALADHLPPGEVLNIGTGVQTANEELVAAAERATGRSVRTRVGAHPGRSWDTGSWVSDPARARAALGWEPRTELERGLRRTWSAEGGAAPGASA
jgi:nucleoside-diphosphate-sugar epimerase